MLDAAIRVTYPYTVVSRIIHVWTQHCQRIAVYEHDDDGANRIHCHIHVEDCRVTEKRLRQLAVEAGVTITVPGNGTRATSLMAFRKKEYDKDPAGYSYLTKGKYEAKYLQGWTKTDTDTWKAGWVTPANHVKRTEWIKLYEDYLPYAPLAPTVLTVDSGKLWFTELCRHARVWVRKRNHFTWCPQIKNQFICIVSTHCWRNDISIPDDWVIPK